MYYYPLLCSERGTKLELGILISLLILNIFRILDWDKIKEKLNIFQKNFDMFPSLNNHLS